MLNSLNVKKIISDFKKCSGIQGIPEYYILHDKVFIQVHHGASKQRTRYSYFVCRIDINGDLALRKPSAKEMKLFLEYKEDLADGFLRAWKETRSIPRATAINARRMRHKYIKNKSYGGLKCL